MLIDISRIVLNHTYSCCMYILPLLFRILKDGAIPSHFSKKLRDYLFYIKTTLSFLNIHAIAFLK